MTNNLNNEEYIHILNGYSFEYRASGKKPYLIALGFYNSRDKRLYESDDLTIFFVWLFLSKDKKNSYRKFLRTGGRKSNTIILSRFFKNLPETDQFKAFVKKVEIPNKNEGWFPAKFHLLTAKGTYFQMDICNVLKQVKELTGSAKTALPEIYSDELSEDD